MDNLLFTSIVIALLYYFLVYLPKKKLARSEPPTFKHSSTQTEPLKAQEPAAIPEPQTIQRLERDISQKERTIIGLNKSYEKLESKKNEQITSLQTQLNSLKTQLNQLAQTQKSENKDLEKTLDALLKAIREISQELD